MEDVLQQAFNALQAVYQGTNAQRIEAQTWLLHLQSSPEGWTVAERMLQDDLSIEVQFFGAQTIRYKVTKDWADLNDDQRMHLKHVVLSKLSRCRDAPRVLVTRLSMAYAALKLRGVTSVDYSIIDEISSVFGMDDGSLDMLVLNLLTVIPEEFRHAPSSEFKPVARNALLADLGSAVHVLEVIAARWAKDDDVLVQILRVMHSWLQFDIDESAFLSSPLFDLATTAVVRIDDGRLLECAIDVFEETMLYAKEDRYPHLPDLVGQVLRSVEPLFDQAIESGDEFTARNLCRFLIAYCSWQLHNLLSLPDNATGVLNFVLKCTGCVAYNVAEQALSFWGDLVSALQTHGGNDGYAIVFMQVSEILCASCVLPLAWPDVSEEFKAAVQQRRHESADVMLALFPFIRQPLMDALLSTLQTQSELAHQGEENRWREVEVALFSIRALAEQMSEDESYFVPTTFSLLKSIPMHPATAEAAVRLIGAYDEWLGANGHLAIHSVEQIFNLGFQAPMGSVNSAAAAALRNVCSHCSEQLLPALTDIVNGASQVLSNLEPRQQVLVLEALGFVISKASLAGNGAVHVEKLCRPLLESVREACVEGNSAFFVHHLSLLAAACRFVDEYAPSSTQVDHPVKFVLDGVTAIIGPNLNSLHDEPDIVEAITLFLTSVVRAGGSALRDTIPQVLHILSNLFQASASSTVFGPLENVAHIVVTTSTAVAEIQEAWESISRRYLSVVAIPGYSDLSNTTHGYFRFTTKLARDLPGIIANSELCVNVVHVALSALRLPERFVCDAVLAFVADYFAHGQSFESIGAIFSGVAFEFVQFALQAVIGGKQRSLVTNIASTLFALLRTFPELLPQLFDLAFTAEHLPCDRMPVEARQRFCGRLSTARTKNGVKVVLDEMSSMCRGFEA